MGNGIALVFKAFTLGESVSLPHNTHKCSSPKGCWGKSLTVANSIKKVYMSLNNITVLYSCQLYRNKQVHNVLFYSNLEYNDLCFLVYSTLGICF